MKTALKHAICIFLIVTLLSLCLVACGDEYDAPSTYEIEKRENDYVLSYSPKDCATQTGIIFYVAQNEQPTSYDYIAQALAHRGYFVAIAKIEGNHAVTFYDNNSVTNNVVNITNSLISNNPQMSFVLAGHLYGGNAVVRYIQENPTKASGAILLAPTYFDQRQLYDENGELLKDEQGNQVYAFDTIANTQIPTLVIDVATPDINRLPQEYTLHILQNATADGFGANSSEFDQATQLQIEAQHSATIEHVLAFLKEAL